MKRLVVVLLLICFSAGQVRADTALGTTTAEIAVWASRAASGPYKVDGDVSTNSPGDWTDILARAAAFAANPLDDNWQGQTAAGAWLPDGHSCTYTEGSGVVVGCVPEFAQGLNILAAGFATMVSPGTNNHAAAIRTALLTQIAYPGTAWLNTAKWPDQQIGDDYSWALAQWLQRMVHAYDYVRSNAVFSAGERLSIDQWFSDAAYFWARNVNHLIVNNAFPDRNTEFDTTVSVGGKYSNDIVESGGPGGGVPTYWDCDVNQSGPFAGTAHSIWNNRSSSQITFAAMGSLINGTLTNDAQTQRWAKMWFKEWLTYATFSGGTFADWDRWFDDQYNQGWIYAAIPIGNMGLIADLFGRRGDTSLFEFTTSSGWTFSSNPLASTTGGPKGLLLTMMTHSKIVDNTLDWRSGSTSAVCSDSSRMIVSTGGNAAVHENHYARSNLYYRNATYTTRYLRTVAGAAAYPADPSSNTNPWGGVNAIFPGILFMYGSMEQNAANPYLGGEPPPSGSGQLELRVIRKLQ